MTCDREPRFRSRNDSDCTLRNLNPRDPSSPRSRFVSARTNPSNPLIRTITSSEPAERDRAIQDLLEGLSTAEVLRTADELEGFRQEARNLYERVRASMFLHYLYRYRLQDSPDLPPGGVVPFDGFSD